MKSAFSNDVVRVIDLIMCTEWLMKRENKGFYIV